MMKILKLSTRVKAAIGYVALLAMFVAAAWFVLGVLYDLTRTDGVEQSINKRQRATNDIVTRLYQAEGIGQSVSAGQAEMLPAYTRAMLNASVAIDTLRTLVSDKAQLARLDTMKMLMRKKITNMEDLLRAMEADNSDELYRKYIDELIARQNDLLDAASVHHSQTQTSTEYAVKKKRKNFFGRLRDAFSKEEKDPDMVTATTTENRTDTVSNLVNPADTVARMLASMRAKVDGSRLAQIEALHSQTAALRASGHELSRKVSELLTVIVDESDKTAAEKHQQSEQVRRRAAREIAGIALSAVILALLFLIIIWRDITRSNHYRQELEKAKKRAEDLLDARERLMLTITHDIKAPVGSIIGYVDMAEQLAKDKRQREYLLNMQSSAHHLLDLVNSLLDFHRLDADKMDISDEPFHPSKLFDAVAASYRPMASAKGLKLNYSCDEALSGMFDGDPFRLRQITENLMSNALKFTQKGSVTLTVGYADGKLSIAVADTGCGISDDDCKRIFQEFTRLKSAQGQEGFGLGLAITQKLVVLLGGDIKIDSKEGRGTTFTVTLPLSPSDAADESEAEVKADDSLHFSRPLRLLMIDDDQLQMQLTEAMLRSLGAEVVACEQPQTLFIKIAEGGYDAVLTDIQMPAMNGFDLLRNIRSLGCDAAPSIPVIAVTARSDMDSASLAGEGFSGCLHKPFRRSEIVAVIEAAIADKEVEVEDKFDFSPLTAFSVDDAAAAQEIMRTFVAETQANVEKMTKAVEASDLATIAAVAHKMLPLFTMIGADRAVGPLSALNDKRGSAHADASDLEMARVVIDVAKKAIKATVYGK